MAARMARLRPARPLPLLNEKWALAPMMGYTDRHYRRSPCQAASLLV